MEQLPVDIEEKLERLPIVPFDGSEEFQNVIFSSDFNDIFDYYSENYMPDVVKSKPELYQRVSLYLTLTNQDTSIVEQTDEVLYRRPCPTIHEFLNDNFYMGYSNATLYPFWKDVLEDIFKQGSPIRKTIFGGSIGIGKSTVARKAFLYVLYRILCLRYPRAAFNIDQDSTIANVVIATTLKQVYEVNLLPFVKLMESMPCFQRVMSVRSFENFNLDDPHCPIPFNLSKSDGTVYFPDNIILTSGSNAQHFTGMNVVNSFCFTEAMKVYTNYGAISFGGLLNRFQRGEKVYTFSINKNGKKEKTLITDVKITGYKKELIRIYYDDERYIECTPEHPFVISNPKKNNEHIVYENEIPYKQAQFLTEEDEIASENDSHELKGDRLLSTEVVCKTIVEKIERICLKEPVPVYDLTVENKNHNFALSIDNGMSVYAHNCDEINDYGTIENTMALLNTLDNRFSSRFQGSDLVFQSIVSSARTENSAMGEYIRHLPKNDPSILLLAPKLYEVKPDPEFRGDGTVFFVQVGNGSIPSKIITDPGELKAIEDKTYEVPAGCVLIDVPTPYRSKFELQLDQSIQDIAGMTTSDNNSVFRDTTRLEEPFLTPEMYFDVSIREDVDILSLLEPYNLFEKTINDRWQFKRAPMANRYIHCDLSGGGSEGQCDTGLCVLHKEWRMNPNIKEKEVVYVVDLQLFINAKSKVDIHAIQTFLINLVVEKNIPIHTVSFDQYNSLMIMQQLEASGCFVNVEKVSVDIKLEPYTNAATLMEKGQVKIGKAPKLKKELEALIIDKGKVTRTTELKDACLLGDTKIPLLSGEVKCIKDLLNCYKGQYIIGYDLDKNKLVPVAIKGVVDKGERDDLYCITLDNGKKVVCTGDHLILRRDKTYVRADDLKVGDSLLPITLLEKVFGTKRYKSDYFYKKVIDPDTHKQIWLHRIVAETKIDEREYAEKRRLVDGSKYLVIHHIDHNKFNNNPDNLQWLTLKEHRKLHGDIFTAYNKSVLKRKKMSEMCKSGKCGFQLLDKINPEEMRKIRIESGRKNITKYNKSKEKWDKLRRHRSEDEEYDKWYKEKVGYNFKNQTKEMIEKRVLSWKANEKNITRSSNRFKMMNSDPDMRKKQMLAKCKKIYQKVLENSDLFVNNDNVTLEMYIDTIRDLKERGIISKSNNASYVYEDLIEAGIPLTNHCVVNIEKLMLKEHVYDIQLDSVHNFMIDSGIFVHNCDALVGAIWDAQMNYADFPVYEFEDPTQQTARKLDKYEDLIDSSSEVIIDL